ncbi:MAG: FecR domain-containing protein, partial [Syntrophobacteraceae bacterium]|nr:FecR domain-containing protein [Syntrophobacteraceae bacterium]
MAKAAKFLALVLAVLLSAAPSAFSQSQEAEEEGILVGRISHVEGQVLRYVPEDEDWVITVKDAPFGFDDALYSDKASKVEIQLPNNTMVRMGEDTQIQLVTLQNDLTEIDVASGVARFYNKSRDGVVRATTPYGYVLAEAATVFDLYVGDESLEVIAIRGTVDFVLESDESRYEVVAGSDSLVSDGRVVTSDDGTVDAEWDDWNTERDNIWNRRLQVKGDSIRYIPESLHDQAYELEENGRWDRVYYNGEHRMMWRPSHVDSDWTPFSEGRWSEWYDDNCWIPDEPFGYVTHHYGNWAYIEEYGGWYWAPPVPRVPVGPAYGCCCCWAPGRVSWIHSEADIGWVPLAPWEPYYCHRPWFPGAVVVGAVGAAAWGVGVAVGSLAYVAHAVVVPHHHFWGVHRYSTVRVRNINKTVIINNYRGARVIDHTVIKNYDRRRARHNFTNAVYRGKPRVNLNRVNHNRQLASQHRKINARDLERRVKNIKGGKPTREAGIRRPKVADRDLKRQARKPRDRDLQQQRDRRGDRGRDRERIRPPGKEQRDRERARKEDRLRGREDRRKEVQEERRKQREEQRGKLQDRKGTRGEEQRGQIQEERRKQREEQRQKLQERRGTRGEEQRGQIQEERRKQRE